MSPIESAFAERGIAASARPAPKRGMALRRLRAASLTAGKREVSAGGAGTRAAAMVRRANMCDEPVRGWSLSGAARTNEIFKSCRRPTMAEKLSSSRAVVADLRSRRGGASGRRAQRSAEEAARRSHESGAAGDDETARPTSGPSELAEDCGAAWAAFCERDAKVSSAHLQLRHLLGSLDGLSVGQVETLQEVRSPPFGGSWLPNRTGATRARARQLHVRGTRTGRLYGWLDAADPLSVSTALLSGAGDAPALVPSRGVPGAARARAGARGGGGAHRARA